MMVPATLVLSVALAALVNVNRRAFRFAQSLVVLPYVTPAVGTVIGWLWMYNPNFGILNAALHALGLRSIGWAQFAALGARVGGDLLAVARYRLRRADPALRHVADARRRDRSGESGRRGSVVEICAHHPAARVADAVFHRGDHHDRPAAGVRAGVRAQPVERRASPGSTGPASRSSRPPCADSAASGQRTRQNRRPSARRCSSR